MVKRYVEVGDGTPIFWRGAWVSGEEYAVNDLVTHNNVSYIYTAAVTAAAANEPGVGADWEDYCDVFNMALVGIATPVEGQWMGVALTPEPNSSETTFAFPAAFHEDTTLIFWNGNAQRRDIDYTESPTTGEITCVTFIPDTGDNLIGVARDMTSTVIGTWHDSYVNGHAYIIGDTLPEAESGYGESMWICILGHTGAAGKNPTGASGATYWKKAAGGGQNGVTSLTGSLNGLGTVTTAPTGATDKMAAKIGGTWSLETFDSLAQRYEVIEIPVESMYPRNTNPAGTPSQVETATNKQNFYAAAMVHTGKTYLCKKLRMPASWDGSALKAIISWYSSGTTSNGVRFGVQLLSVGDNESLDQAAGTAVEVTDNATGTAYRELTTGTLSAITPAGTPAGGEKLLITLYRDPVHGDDNLDESVYITGLTLFFNRNKHSEV